jgi:excisionase family DNA binding protein
MSTGQTAPAHQLISAQQAMGRLGIKTTKLYELLNAGEIKSILIGRRRLILESSVDELVERRLKAVA